MDLGPLLITYLNKVLKDVAPSPIIIQEEISMDKLGKPRLRAQSLIQIPHNIAIKEGEGEMVPIMDMEVEHCAAVIVAAFLNPITTNWDYDRFAQSPAKRETTKYFSEVHLGFITKPSILVDIHGKIILWYLPGLLLPHRVEEMNRVTKGLKEPLLNAKKKGENSSSWRDHNFTCDGPEAVFGAGKLSLSVGRFMPGHQRLQDSLKPAKELRNQAVCQWLQLMSPAEALLNAVLQIVHPEMWEANSKATTLMVEQLDIPSLTWPTVYPGMDIIANRLTRPHKDSGGALTFYDHLISFGQSHDGKITLDDFNASFAYQSGTSILFSGTVLTHSVSGWSGGERLVVAHYAKDDVHDRLNVRRPLLPTQLGWWRKYAVSE